MQRLRDITAFLFDVMEWRVLKSPKFLLPMAAIVVFALAALSSTVRFLEEEGIFSHTLEHSLAVGELEDHFHDFEESLLLYASGHKSVSREDLVQKGKAFGTDIEKFTESDWAKELGPKAQPSLKSLADAIVVVDYTVHSAAFLEDRKISESIGESLLNAHRAIDALDIDGAVQEAKMGSYEERRARRTKIFWSVFLMGFSGFVLILVLLDRLASLDRVERERRKAVALEARRAAAMDEAFEGMILSDPDGTIVYVNRAALRLSGYESCASLIGHPWRMFFSNDQGKRFADVILPRLGTEERWSGSAFGIRKDGRVSPLDVSVALLPDGGYIWVLRDLSRQVESERLSQRRLAAIEASGDGVGIVGADGNLSYMNHAMMDIHGISEDEESRWFGKPWDSLYEGQDRERLHEQVLPALLQTGYWSGEIDLARRDGKRSWVEMNLTRLPDGGIVSVLRDISDRKRAETEKEELQAQFHQAQKMEAVGRLAGGIAHDFNNILAAIMGYAEFLEEDLSSDPEKKKFAEGILQAGGQARGLIDQLLSFSRRKEATRTVIDVSGVVNETVSLLRASLPRTISLETDIATPAPVCANSTQIAQAVMNLCVNARDAMEDGHGTIHVTLEIVEADPDLYEDILSDDLPGPGAPPPIRVHDVEAGHCCLELGVMVRGRRYVRLSVGDTGSGMSRTIMEHIFEPFFTTKDVDKGTGLGLANVHGVVTAHQGALIVDSIIGEGTRFDLFFPIDEEDFDFGEAVPNYGNTETLILKGQILLVEDQEPVREMMAVMLRRMGYEVDFCESAMEALPHLRQFPDRYDLVVTDHNMPKMTGLELADQIYTQIPSLPFIIISGYSKESLDSAPDEHPSVRAILRKPVDRQALGTAIQNILSRPAAA